MSSLLHDKLNGIMELSSMDCAEGYFQIPIRESDKHYTAFITEFGTFEFNVMAFGLKNAPASWQRMVDNVLGDFKDQ